MLCIFTSVSEAGVLFAVRIDSSQRSRQSTEIFPIKYCKNLNNLI